MLTAKFRYGSRLKTMVKFRPTHIPTSGKGAGQLITLSTEKLFIKFSRFGSRGLKSYRYFIFYLHNNILMVTGIG
jgi:hypothetical protein